MRHRVIGKKLNRDKDHRRSLMKNLASSLILNGKIETSVVKAKFIRPFVEKLVTKAKDSSFHNVKLLRARLGNEEALRKLFSELAPSYSDRDGGYTRISRTGKIQKGDNSELATIEFVTSPVKETKEKSSETRKTKKVKEEKNKEVSETKVEEVKESEEVKEVAQEAKEEVENSEKVNE